MEMKVGTIRQIHRALLQNGYHVSEYALRQWIRSGKIPAVYSGNTAYVPYEKVLSYLCSNPVESVV